MYHQLTKKFVQALPLCLVLVISCTESHDSGQDRLQLDRLYSQTQTQLTEIEKDYKAATDSGEKDRLAERRELAKSRLERLVELGATPSKDGQP